jgi:hypothetical protein
MVLQTIRNEYVRFGGHVDIEISYKISWLEFTKIGPNFAQFTLFTIGAVLRLF